MIYNIYIIYIYIDLLFNTIVSLFRSLCDSKFIPMSTYMLVPVVSGAPANVSTLSQCHGLKLR